MNRFSTPLLRQAARLSFLGLLLTFAVVAAGCEFVEEGNADVYSVNFVFDLGDADLRGNVASVQYDIPGITRSVVRDGAVLVYYRYEGTWTALPFTLGVEKASEPVVDYTFTFGYGYDHRFLELFVEASSDDNVVWNDIEDTPLFRNRLEMKAVIIDALPAGSARVDLKSYEAVKAYYGLKD